MNSINNPVLRIAFKVFISLLLSVAAVLVWVFLVFNIPALQQSTYGFILTIPIAIVVFVICIVYKPKYSQALKPPESEVEVQASTEQQQRRSGGVLDSSRNWIKKNMVEGGRRKEGRIIPINGKLKQVFFVYLEKRPADVGTDYLFTTENGVVSFWQVGKVLQRAAKKAGIEKPVNSESLRNSFAENLLVRGANVLEIQALMEHRYLRTTTLYLNTAMDGLRKAIDLL